MSNTAPDLIDTDSAREEVLYEQPLTERMRTFLRLEFLFRQLRHHAQGRTAWETRAAIGGLLEVLAILSRGDVRCDALKELERHATKLAEFEARPGVDSSRLSSLLEMISAHREALNGAGKQSVQDLCKNDFLSSIRHRSAIPGGTCAFDLPDYNHWLSRPYNRRLGDLDEWMAHLEPLNAAVKDLLWLTRESADARECVAAGGLYQHSLERGSACQLLRVSLPSKSSMYPEISGSQHRFTVRFRTWRAVSQRPELVTRDVNFYLSCC